MTPRAQERSAFCTRRGLYHFKRMPFGLSNAPATFCRLMHRVLRDHLWRICLCYLDDVIVYATSKQELLERLHTIFSCLHNVGLKVKPSKCSLFKERISFLGHMVSAQGIDPQEEKIKSIQDWPVPKCVRDVRAFFGLASYYRKFVKNFASIAEPLSALTKKGVRFSWSPEAQQAFEHLKRALAETVTLAYPQPNQTFTLDTDASDVAVGAILSTMVDGVERPIAIFSRIMNSSQRNYCPTRRELLAVIAGLQHFRHYLVGASVILRTDHYSLKWLKTFKRPEGILARWIETLAEFDYTVEHRPGRLHSNADGLSRPFCKQCYDRPSHIPWVDEMERADAAVGPWSVHLLEIAPELTDADVARLQDEDEVLGPVKSMLSQGYSPTLDDLRALPLEGRKLWSLRPTILLQNQVLVRRDGDAVQLVVPQSLRHQLFTHTHAGPLLPTWVHKECWRNYVAFTIGPACLGTLMPGVGNAKDVPSVGGRLADLMATFARSIPVHQWTWSPSTSCLAYLPHPMAINISWWPQTILLNGSRPYPCATLRHTRACVHYTALSSAASACLANCTAIRGATLRVSW